MLKLIQLFNDDNFFKRMRLLKKKLDIEIEMNQILAEQYFLSCETNRRDTIYLINEGILNSYFEPIQQLVASNAILFVYNHEQQIIRNELVGETTDFFLKYEYEPVDFYSSIKQCKKLLHGHTKTEFSRKLFSSSVSEIEQIINDSAQRIFWKNTEGRYIGCNLLFANDFGFKHVSDVSGKTDNQFLSEKSALDFTAYDNEILKTGEVYEFSKEIKFQNGEKKTLLIKKYPHLKAGVIIGLVGKYELIEEKKEAFYNEIDFFKVYEKLLDNVSEFIFLKDTKCNYISINSRYASYLGIENIEEVIDKNDFDFFDNETAKRYFAAEQKLIFEGEVSTDILYGKPGDEDRAIVRIPIRNEQNTTIAILGVSQTDSSLKTHNNSMLISKIGHDIRTPMNGIIGMAEVMTFDNLRAEQLKMVDIIKNSGNKLLSIIDDILTIIRIDWNECSQDSVEFDISDILKKVCDDFHQKSSNKQIHINSRIDQNIPSQLKGNIHQLQKIMQSILVDCTNPLNDSEFDIGIEAKYYGCTNTQHYLTFKITTQWNIDSDINFIVAAENEIINQYGTEGLKLLIAKKLIAKNGGELKIQSTTKGSKNYQFNLTFDK